MASHASYNITIDHTAAPPGSDHSSSITDGEDSSGTGVQVSPTSVGGSHEYSDPPDENEGFSLVYPDEIGPSDSASVPRTSNRHRPIVEAPRPEPARRQSAHRQRPPERVHHHSVPRPRRPQLPTSSGSVDSNEDWPAYGRRPAHYHAGPYPQYGHAPAASPPNYATSYSSAQAYPPYQTPAVVAPGQQLVPFAGPPAPYNYQPYHGVAAGQTPGYYPPAQHGVPAMANPSMAHPSAPYPGQEIVPHSTAPSFYTYPPQGYPIHQAIGPPAVFHSYAPIYSPPPANTPPPSADSSKDDEKLARLEKLFLDQEAKWDAKEAAALKAAEDAAAQAKADKQRADEIAAAAAAAAAAATEEAEKKAAEKAADEAAKAKAAADEAEKKAAEAAAAAAVAAPPPPPPQPEERKKPIRFKDAVGRKFSFPFHLCSTWDGMDYLIRQAFLHVEVIGPHVAEGHYDLVGPNGEIILPQVWETVIEPDWTITMHMWPMPEPPKPEELPPAVAGEAIIDVPPNNGKGIPPPPPPPPPPGAPGIKGAPSVD
ncbi:MAG: hypothetical protein Q9222_001779 [Ikaeria aurantiellina]